MLNGGLTTMLVVTTEGVPGFEVTMAIGEVCGIAALSRNPYSAGVKALTGAMNPRVNEELTRARDEAVADLIRAARRRGANAVVGMRFDNRDVSDRWAEICAYGTAVRVQRIRIVGTARPVAPPDSP
jgi:uncharacterized protein YbjQ (UPF0145 family)